MENRKLYVNNITSFIEFINERCYLYKSSSKLVLAIQVIDRGEKRNKKVHSSYIELKSGWENKLMKFHETWMNYGRIYISAVPRSVGKVNKLLMKKLIDDTDLDPVKIFLSEINKAENAIEKLWKIDLDTKDEKILSLLKDKLNPVWVFPSVKGYHILVKPFDSRNFEHDIQKDNVILLYSNN